MKRIIPATMASQHPDNAKRPYWHNNDFVKTTDEIYECFLTFSELNISEYKWDWEGKFVDESVIEKVLNIYYNYFKQHPIGQKKFLTFRLPNIQAKNEFRLGRAFMVLLSASSLAQEINFHSPPMFEVILPMTKNEQHMLDVQNAFCDIASLKHRLFNLNNSRLKHIEIIPLFEDINTIVNSHRIITNYLILHKKHFKSDPPYLRPYLARSDPALNAGMIPAVLAVKIALSRYAKNYEKDKLELYPILGVGALPFRGGLTPYNNENFIDEYAGTKTVLIQSAFRYDYPIEDAKKSVEILEKKLPKSKTKIITNQDEERLLIFMQKAQKIYQQSIIGIAPQINKMASLIPQRRERIQHEGLLGYFRNIGKVKLPRAINFTASLYSLGIPPEIIATGRALVLSKDFDVINLINMNYLNLRNDLKQSGKFLNKEVLHKLAKNNKEWLHIKDDVDTIEKHLGIELGPSTKEEMQHHAIVNEIYNAFNDDKKDISDLIVRSGILRHSLG